MKIWTFLVLCFISSTVIAQSKLNKRVSVYVNDTPISEILKKIQKESEIFFSYSPNLIPASEKATIKAYNRSIRDILTTLFLNYNIEFRELGDNVIIYKAKGSASIYKPDLPEIINTVKPEPTTKPVPITPKVSDEAKTDQQSELKIDGGKSDSGNLKGKKDEVASDEPHVIGLRADPEPEIPDSIMQLNQDSIDQLLTKETLNTIKAREKIKYVMEIINTSTLLPIGKRGNAEIDGLTVRQKLNQIEVYGANISAERGRYRGSIGMQYAKHSDSLSTYIREDASYDNWDVFADDSLYDISNNDTTVVYLWDSTYSYIVDSIDQPYNHINTYKYFEIPLSFSYHLVHTHSIDWSLTASMTNSFLIGSSSQNKSLVEAVKGVYNGVTSKYVASFGASSEILIHMDEKVSVKIGLTYRHAFKPLEKNARYPLKKRYLFGYGFGIQYLLSKD